ncbi:TIGR02117 family protein [Rhizobium sp. CG5]|uniref:TIGR02117 family protein n=1 Tax=Rhizobium sp. CG5 TaxID=2726076 RepID=UPI002033C772|nr:TIGR02117 family protein [Rhizobium sp. CG5]MCM2473214.1 TIGR02117 family protein [Rhizobium sp. CG5]
MLKPVRSLLAVLLSLLALAGAGTLVPRPLWSAGHPGSAEAAARRILVLSNPIHTDIAIPLDDETRRRFAFLDESGMPLSHPEARWLVLGWGGRAFYTQTPTWADLKPLPLLKGLTLDRSVMHVDVAGDIVEPSEGIIGFDVDAERYQALLAFIAASFRGEGDRVDVIPGAGYGANDRFFEADGWFSALLGCNTWTAAALRAAGMRTGWWNPLPVTLTTSLALFN